MVRNLILLLLVLAITGCSYVNKRLLDLSDIIIIKIHQGYGLGVKVRASEFIGTQVGFCASVSWPTRLRDIEYMAPNFDHYIGLGFVGGVFTNELRPNMKWPNDEDMFSTSINIGPFCIWDMETPLHRWADCSLGLFVVIGGITIGVSPGEILDFAVGFSGIDIGNDDKDPPYAHIRGLIESLSNSTDAKLRMKAAKDLGSQFYINPTVIEVLINSSKSDMEGDVRIASLQALEEIYEGMMEFESHGVLFNKWTTNIRRFIKGETILPIAQKDQDIGVKRAAIKLLGKLEYSPAKEFLLPLLNDDKLKRSAAFALTDIGEVKVVPYLVKSAKESSDWSTRVAYVIALGAFNDKMAIDALVHIVQNDREWRVRASAMDALYKLNYIRLKELLEEVIESYPVEKFRSEARDTLDQLERRKNEKFNDYNF
ncbi:MAG: HEAT repeat domain-containing protein [Planctomycetota bacterium]|nr:MAG: HEAT repeat domain-containing protein [Planctomycetota bacterium]